jgi:hypothetical protein
MTGAKGVQHVVKVEEWSGLEATLLRKALRLSLRGFAAKVGVAQRTVSNWAKLGRQIHLHLDSQALLDTMLSRADDEAHRRFTALLAEHGAIASLKPAKAGISPPVGHPVTASDRLPISGPQDSQANGIRGGVVQDVLDMASGLGLDFTATPSGVLATCEALWAADLNQADFLSQQEVHASTLLPAIMRWLVALPSTPAGPTNRVRKVTAGDIEAVRAMVHMLEDLDHRFGGGHVRSSAVRFLYGEVTALLHGQYANPAIGRALFAVAARFTFKTGAMAYDVGLNGLARRYFVQALNMAHASGDRALGGKVLALASHQANFMGEFQEAVDLARAAKLGAAGQATATVHAMFCAMEARALANLGDRRNCIAALNEAERAFARRRPGEDPDWIHYFDEAELLDEFGHSLAALGDADDAIHYARLALEQSSAAFPRSRTFCRLTLAGAYLTTKRPRERDVEAACAVAAEALSMASHLKSDRVRIYLKRFKLLMDSYAQVPTVTAFHERWHHVFTDA